MNRASAPWVPDKPDEAMRSILCFRLSLYRSWATCFSLLFFLLKNTKTHKKRVKRQAAGTNMGWVFRLFRLECDREEKTMTGSPHLASCRSRYHAMRGVCW